MSLAEFWKNDEKWIVQMGLNYWKAGAIYCCLPTCFLAFSNKIIAEELVTFRAMIYMILTPLETLRGFSSSNSCLTKYSGRKKEYAGSSLGKLRAKKLWQAIWKSTGIRSSMASAIK